MEEPLLFQINLGDFTVKYFVTIHACVKKGKTITGRTILIFFI